VEGEKDEMKTRGDCEKTEERKGRRVDMRKSG